jgi:DNA-binding MarR family transcriptional regulator
MSKQSIVNVASSSLEVLGIDTSEERVYRFLLGHDMATAGEVARALQLSPRIAKRLLEQIEAKGLAYHSPERPRRYIAASPELAGEALIKQRQADLEKARATLSKLKKEAAKSNEAFGDGQLVEVITSLHAMDQIFTQLWRTAQRDVINFQCAPMMLDTPENGLLSRDKRTGPKGARMRSISDESFLALPGALNALRLDMKKGEEARVFPTLPIKMVVFDQRVGMIPIDPESPIGPMLLVRSPALVRALYALFENTWERSTPMILTKTGEVASGEISSPGEGDADELIALLAAGLADKAIAYEMGISLATFNRRMAKLTKHHGTRSRFQLGWRVAEARLAKCVESTIDR